MAVNKHERILPIEIITQPRYSDWCWAACTEMVLNYKRPTLNIRMCNIVSFLVEKGINYCCQHPIPHDCIKVSAPIFMIQQYLEYFYLGCKPISPLEKSSNRYRPEVLLLLDTIRSYPLALGTSYL